MRRLFIFIVLLSFAANAQSINWNREYMKTTWQYEMEKDPFAEIPMNAAWVFGETVNRGECCFFSIQEKTLLAISTGVHKKLGRYIELQIQGALTSKQNSTWIGGTMFVKIDNNPTLEFKFKVHKDLSEVWLDDDGFDPSPEFETMIDQMKKGKELFIKLSREGGEYGGTADNFVVKKFTLKGSTKAINGIHGIKSSPTIAKKSNTTVSLGNFINDIKVINPFDLIAYYNSFVKTMKKFNVYKSHGSVDIRFGQLEGEALAVAKRLYDDKRVEIVVDPENWQKATPAKRAFIMYHELAHDIFNSEHTKYGLMVERVGNVSYDRLYTDVLNYFLSLK